VPLTPFQAQLLADLGPGPEPGRYLAGGAAIHLTPQSARYSDDLDFFHDAEARVAATFAADRARLEAQGYTVTVVLVLPGFVRTLVARAGEATRVDWAHDSAWRFLPLVPAPRGGWLLHPVDLAVNKVLALAGRDEVRDYVDTLYVHATVLPLAALVWAAAGKDPGFTPLGLLELLKRRGRPQAAEVARLHLAQPFDLGAAKITWLAALAAAEAFVRARPPEELGCLYWHAASGTFVMPEPDRSLDAQGIVPHFGAPGGVIPQVGPAPDA
jgi:hypothetical protein